MKEVLTMSRQNMLQALMGDKTVCKMFPNLLTFPTANLRAMLVRRRAPAHEQNDWRNLPENKPKVEIYTRKMPTGGGSDSNITWLNVSPIDTRGLCVNGNDGSIVKITKKLIVKHIK